MKQPLESSAALDAFAQDRIAERLREALTLAEESLEANADPLREILADVLDRTDAWVLVKAIDGAHGSTQPVFRLARTAGDVDEHSPVTDWLLIPFGTVAVERPASGGSFVFTKKHAESAKRWFDQMGRKLAIDYEHQSFERFNTRPDGLRPVAGWIAGLEIREDGLWAVDVVWTERARELLRKGEYKYFSPVIYWTDEDHSDVAALGPVALTNDPAMRGVPPLAASRRGLDEQLPGETAAIVKERSEPFDSSVAFEEFVPREELEATQADLALLRNQLQAQEADTFVERGMRLGKILDSTSMDWRADFLRDSEQAEERLSRAPVMLPPGRLIKLDERGEPTGLSRGRRRFERDAETYSRLGIEVEDLEAFERALAAGRVFGLPVTQS